MPPEITALLLQWGLSAWPLALILTAWIALRIRGPVTVRRNIDGANFAYMPFLPEGGN